jgi:hypothetical protein
MKAPKTIRVLIVPLAVLKKRLATAQKATATFKRNRDGLVWSKADLVEHGRLLATERKANVAVNAGKSKS